jgi:hypothetical protein
MSKMAAAIQSTINPCKLTGIISPRRMTVLDIPLAIGLDDNIIRYDFDFFGIFLPDEVG